MKWKTVCARHMEELDLMQSYQDIKRAGVKPTTFNKALRDIHTPFQRTCVRCLQSGWGQPEPPGADV